MEQVIIKILTPEKSQKEVIKEAVKELGGFESFIKKGDKVLVKPNFNTADPFPASSDPVFVRAVVELILETGAGEVIVGESSTMYQNTRDNMEKLGIFELENIDPNVKVISFDEGRWIKKMIPDGKYLRSISVPEILEKADKLIFLPCIKTHFIAKYSGALKLGVGLMRPLDRVLLHANYTEEKIVEMNLAFKPDLIIMDGRKCFITNGPSSGEVREPNLVLASTGRIAIDVEAVNIIKSYPGNDLAEYEPDDLIQIKRSKELMIA